MKCGHTTIAQWTSTHGDRHTGTQKTHTHKQPHTHAHNHTHNHTITHGVNAAKPSLRDGQPHYQWTSYLVRECLRGNVGVKGRQFWRVRSPKHNAPHTHTHPAWSHLGFAGEHDHNTPPAPVLVLSQELENKRGGGGDAGEWRRPVSMRRGISTTRASGWWRRGKHDKSKREGRQNKKADCCILAQPETRGSATQVPSPANVPHPKSVKRLPANLGKSNPPPVLQNQPTTAH